MPAGTGYVSQCDEHGSAKTDREQKIRRQRTGYSTSRTGATTTPTASTKATPIASAVTRRAGILKYRKRHCTFRVHSCVAALSSQRACGLEPAVGLRQAPFNFVEPIRDLSQVVDDDGMRVLRVDSHGGIRDADLSD